MAKLGILSSLIAIALALGISTQVSADDDAGPCKRKDFKTELVKTACTKGTKDKKAGQEAAKDVMKAFMKEKGVKTCNECHNKLSPEYTLKDTGLKRFQDLGGK